MPVGKAVEYVVSPTNKGCPGYDIKLQLMKKLQV